MLDSIKLIAGFLIAAALATAGGLVVHKLDLAKYEKLQLQYADADNTVLQESAALQNKTATIALNAGAQEALVQLQIVTTTLTTIQEVTKYVTDASDCITFGLVRVLDAAALGVDPATLSLPAGQSNDACAPVHATALASSVTKNYGAARANAEQLNALEDTIRKMGATRP